MYFDSVKNLKGVPISYVIIRKGPTVDQFIQSRKEQIINNAPFPVELAEYVLANGIEEEPAYKWWVKQTMHEKKRSNHIKGKN
jgi:hypothetical protein